MSSTLTFEMNSSKESTDPNVLQKTAELTNNAEWSATSSAFGKSNPINDSPINTEILEECLANPMNAQDPNVLQETAELTNNAEWSATSSAFGESNPINDSPINTEILEECLANPINAQGIEEFMVVESTINTTNFNVDDTQYLSTRKPTAFQRKHKPCTNNDSIMFENIFNDDSLMESTQNSVCLSRFQKRTRQLPPNDDFVEINKSDNSGIDSVEGMSMNFPKFQFSKNYNDQSCFNLTDYSLSSTDVSVNIDNPNISKVNKNTVFKKPLDSSVLRNDSSNVTNISKTEVLTHKFTKKNIEVVDDTVFDNVINDSSMTSDVSSKNKSLINSSSINVQEISKCSTILDMQSLNHTYDIPVNSNDSHKKLSLSVTNNCELNDVAMELINETYTLKNGSVSNKPNCNVSLSLDNAKNTLSDTYIIENNVNDTFCGQNFDSKSVSKTVNALIDTSSIHNQSKSSVCKPNFKRKLQLDNVSQNFTLTHDDTNYDEVNEAIDNESNKFKLKKTYHEADSQMFDNIISTSQEIDEISSSECINHSKNNLPSTLIASAENSNGLSNISLESKSIRDMNGTTDKSLLTQQSNIVLDKSMEIDVNTSKSLLFRHNVPNSGHRISGKFNFFRRFGRHSLSFQEKSKNSVEIKRQSISFNITHNKTPSQIFNSFHTPTSNVNINVETCSEVCAISDDDTDSNTKQQRNVSSPSFVLNSSNQKVESNGHGSTLSQNTSFQPSQSPELHFAGARDLNAHSGVFSGLIDDSFKSDVSLNISKQVKFKTRKNVPEEADSMMFENVIKNTQESNITSTTDKTLSHSVFYNQSKIQNDEISLFANADELWSPEKSPRSANYSLKKHNGNNLNLEETSGSKDKLSVSTNTSNDSSLKHTDTANESSDVSSLSVVNNNTYCESSNLLMSMESMNTRSLSNITAGLGSNSICQTKSFSKSILASNNKKLEDQSNSFELIDAKINSNNTMAHVSTHSTSMSCNNESLNSNISQKSLLFKDSTSFDSNNEGLTLFNTTLESLDSDKSQKRSLTSRHSKNLIFENDPSKSLNSSIESSKSYNTSSNLSESSVSSTHLEMSILNNKESLNSFKSSKSGRSSNKSTLGNSLYNISNTKDTSNVSNTSVKLEDAANISKMSTCASEQENLSTNNLSLEVSSDNHKVPENSGLSSLKTISEPPEEKILLTNHSEKSNFAVLENTTIISRRSTRSSKQKDNSIDNIRLEVSNINQRKSVDTESSVLKNTSAFSKEKKSLNKSKQSNSGVFENENKKDNSINRISTRLSRKINCSNNNVESKVSNISHTLTENEESLKKTSVFLKEKDLSLNQSQILNSITFKEKTNDVSISRKKSTSLLEQKNHSLNGKLEVSNIDSRLSENEKLLFNQSNRSCPIALEDKTNHISNISTISTRSSKQKKHSNHEAEPEISTKADGYLKKNKSSLKNSTRVTRSSSVSGIINESSLLTLTKNKSLLSKNNTSNVSNCSIKSPINIVYLNNDNIIDETLSSHFSKSSISITHSGNDSVKNDTMFNQTWNTCSSSNVADMNDEDNDNESNNSIFWTNLSENSTSKSNVLKSNTVNNFQTPKTNKLAINGRITNTIGIMSENRKKLTHPGTFQLVDPLDIIPLTRSLTRRPSIQSPSLLTRAFAGNSTCDGSMSLSQSFPDTIVDQLQVEENIKEKFKSLYNKEPWITKRLYNFLVGQLQPKYNIYAVKYAEKFVKYLASILNQVYNDVDLQLYSDLLKYHMARYDIIETTYDYVGFLTDFIPSPYYDKFVPGYLETSAVKFDPMKSYVPIMEDEDFLEKVLEYLNK